MQVNPASVSAGEIASVIHHLVKTAAEEYSIAVKDGAVVNAHEYQDALGFVRVARRWTDRLEDAGADAEAVGRIRHQLDEVKPAWPSLIPPKTVEVDPSLLHGAAARIEIAALGLN